VECETSIATAVCAAHVLSDSNSIYITFTSPQIIATPSGYTKLSFTIKNLSASAYKMK